MTRFSNMLKNKIIIMDGATGTNLLDKGLMPGESPSILNIRNAQAVLDLHKRYIAAGSQLILTNTFTANPLNIRAQQLNKILIAAVKLAQRAAGKHVIILGDIGPLGELIKPFGELPFEKVYNIYDKICKTLHKAGIDKFMIETFTSIMEAKAAFLAAKNYSEDLLVCLSLQDNCRTLMGETPESIAVTFEALGARAVGINCTEPKIAIKAVQRMSQITGLPLIIKPNAGKIKIIGQKVYHSFNDRQMAKFYRQFIQAGASIIGGCCGTTPEYIARVKKQKAKRKKRKIEKTFRLTSSSEVYQTTHTQTLIIGERLNPSGRKKIKKHLAHGDYKIYAEEARLQQEAGAEALDVNAFTIDSDEKSTLENAVFEVLKTCSLPLFIDTQDFSAALSVLRFYPGIGVYNSIPARRKELMKWLPMVKKYGFKAVISLVGKNIPRTVKQRLDHVKLALAIAKKVDFPVADMIFDPLVFSAATDRVQIIYTLKTVEQLAKRGLKTILGISNVSFGLPERSHLNTALAVMAVQRGANFLILNPLDKNIMHAVHSTRTLLDSRPIIIKKETYAKKTEHTSKNLIEAIIHGNAQASRLMADKMLRSGVKPQILIDEHVSKALKRVGDFYETGKYFIPDLLKAAEASKSALALAKQYLKKKTRRGSIVLATVKGDIHDIGKNIAAMIFESAGYEVVDLGKDVQISKIIKTLKRVKPDALGLSALLTTTMPEMERVVKALERENIGVKVIIGGPNVSKQYATKIGAYGAAKNVLEGLELLKNIK